jgi:hypothetical protein
MRCGTRILLFALGLATVGGCSNDKNPVQSTPCNYALSSTSQSPAAEGGTSSVTVTRSSGSCGWTATSDASWITLSNPSGSDTAALSYSVAANAGTDSRTGHITVNWTGGSSQLTVTQAGMAPAQTGCAYSVNPTSVTAPAEGSTGQSTVTVTGTGNCNWSAQSNQFWIHITSATSGPSTGTINYTVDANTGAQRFGRIIVTHTTGTTDISFTQNAPCPVSLNPATQSIPEAGGAFTTAFTTAAGCAWTATSDASWLTISSATSGTGDATIAYAVAANTGATRTGHITLTAGASTTQLTVNQAATSCSLPDMRGFLSFTTSSGSVMLSWGAATGTVTSYVIEVGRTTGGAEVAVIDTNNTATTYTVTGLMSGAYFVRVRARNSCGVSGPSNEVNPTVP